MNFIIIIFLIHFISDFIFQTHEMSLKKSKSIFWLSYHVIVYSFITTILWYIFFGGMIKDYSFILYIFIITFITHWITDYFTSKWTSKLWEQQRVHDFFVVIGLDQLIHTITLLKTYNFLIHTI